MNDIFLLSLTHHTAPIEVRERVALDANGKTLLLDDIRAAVNECVAIVTCNRTEIYGVSKRRDAPMQVRSMLARHAGLQLNALLPHMRCLQGIAAARHLFRVAAGLDSLVIGEPQILGQVRQAADFAREGDYSGPVLERLFNYAVVTGKRARHETRISEGAGSISHAAVELARNTLGELRDRQGLVVGLGEMGQLVARNLSSHGLTDLQLCNRSPERSAEVARELHGFDVGWDSTWTTHWSPLTSASWRPEHASRSSARVATRADHAVTRGSTTTTHRHRCTAQCRPDARSIPGLHLHDIDSLQTIREENLQTREQTIPEVDAIVEQELTAFSDWHQGRASAPVIAKPAERAESIREQEVQRALRRLGHLDERDREVVMALSHAITNKMLHEPVTRLKRSTVISRTSRSGDRPFWA